MEPLRRRASREDARRTPSAAWTRINGSSPTGLGGRGPSAWTNSTPRTTPTSASAPRRARHVFDPGCDEVDVAAITQSFVRQRHPAHGSSARRMHRCRDFLGGRSPAARSRSGVCQSGSRGESTSSLSFRHWCGQAQINTDRAVRRRRRLKSLSRTGAFAGRARKFVIPSPRARPTSRVLGGGRRRTMPYDDRGGFARQRRAGDAAVP